MSPLAIGRMSFRMSSFIAFSCLITIVRLQQAEEVDVETTLRVSSIFKDISRLMLELGWTDKPIEEISRKMMVDFSTLSCEIEADPEMQAKILLKLYALKLLPDRIRETAETLHPSDRAKYNLSKYNKGIVALGVENFKIAAAQFLEDEASGGEIEIVSVGSEDGTIEKEILAEYRARFHKELPRIKLVNPDPKFDDIVDFKTVDHLIRKRPNVVGNCVVFIIWPPPEAERTGLYRAADSPKPYDIEAIFKLQPKAVFIVYEYTGGSGSLALRSFLRDDNLERLSPLEFGLQNWMSQCDTKSKKISGLDHYSVTEIAHRKLSFSTSGTYIMRMVKVTRTRFGDRSTSHDYKEL